VATKPPEPSRPADPALDVDVEVASLPPRPAPVDEAPPVEGDDSDPPALLADDPPVATYGEGALPLSTATLPPQAASETRTKTEEKAGARFMRPPGARRGPNVDRRRIRPPSRADGRFGHQRVTSAR